MTQFFNARPFRSAVGCVLIAFISLLPAFAQDRDGQGAASQHTASKRMRLIKTYKVKAASFPEGKNGRTSRVPPKGSTTMSLEGGGCKESNSQEGCGGSGDFDVLQFQYIFDSTLNSPGTNDVAMVEILSRVEIDGWRTVYVSTSTEWGGLMLLLEDLNNTSLSNIGIRESDIGPIKDAAELKKRDPVALPKISVTATKAGEQQSDYRYTNSRLRNAYPNAVPGDSVVVQYSDGCLKFEFILVFAGYKWDTNEQSVSCQ